MQCKRQPAARKASFGASPACGVSLISPRFISGKPTSGIHREHGYLNRLNESGCSLYARLGLASSLTGHQRLSFTVRLWEGTRAPLRSLQRPWQPELYRALERTLPVRRASRREKMRRRRIWWSWSLKMIQLQRQRMLQKCSLRSAIALSRGCVLTQQPFSRHLTMP